MPSTTETLAGQFDTLVKLGVLKGSEKPQVGVTLGSTVRETLMELGQKHTTPGEIGVELEAEGSLSSPPLGYWSVVPDGSLRNGGMEYVLKKPIDYTQLGKALDEFVNGTTACKFDLNSPRTSCHVHFNAQTYTFKQIYAIIGAYWMFEDILLQHCGPSRVSNLFCLPASAAQKQVNDVVDSVRKTLTTWNQRFLLAFSQDYYKYAALNLSCLMKYGSLEFRGMRGIYTKKEISDWVGMLRHMIQKAAELNSPVQVYQVFKDASPMGLVDYFFGPYSSIITEQKYWKTSIKNSSMFLAQLSYVVDQADKGKFSRPPATADSLRNRRAGLGISVGQFNPTTVDWGTAGVPSPAWAASPPPTTNGNLWLHDSEQVLDLDGEQLIIDGTTSLHNVDLTSTDF
jgi:hypothetical protein